MIEDKIKRIIKNIIDLKLLKQIMIATFIIGLIIHAYGYMNITYNHDSLNFWQEGDVSWKLSLGRFMQYFSINLRGYLVVHWVVGIISLFLLSLSTYMIVQIADIKSKINIYLIPTIILTSLPFINTNAIYTHETDAFMYGMFFSILAVYIYNKYKFGYLISPIFLMCGIGFYQAFICVALGMYTILIIRKINDKNNIQELIVYTLKIIINILVSLGIYYIVNMTVLKLTGIHVSDSYNSVNNVFNSISNIFNLIINTYTTFFSNLLTPYSYQSNLMTTLNYGLIIGFCFHIIILIKNQTNKIKKFFLVVIVICLPLLLNGIYILSSGLLHSVMIYGTYMFYVILLHLMEKHKIIFNYMLYILIFISVFNGYIYVNSIYQESVLSHDSLMFKMNNIVDDLEDMDNYIAGESEVVFIGNSDDILRPSNSNIAIISYQELYKIYFNYVVEYNINIVNQDVVDEYKTMQSVLNMNVYPNKNYIQDIDNRFVIRLSYYIE